MINIKDKITFFNSIEEKLWGEKVEANKYFATLCVLCIALLGAWHTAGSFLSSALDAPTEMSVFRALLLLAYLWVLNIAESVLACKDTKTATLRSLLVLGAFVCAYIVGVILGVIVIIIVCIVLVVIGLYFLMGMLNGSLNTSSGRSSSNEKDEYEYTDNGMVKVSDMDSSRLRMTDVNGHDYARNSESDRWHRI